MQERIFGLIESGDAVHAVALRKGALEAEIITFGARLHRLIVPDARGVGTDIVLGHADLQAYETDPHHLGAVVGRFANRIAHAEIPFSGGAHRLSANDGKHTLHGGFRGFSRRIWAITERSDDMVRLSLHSPDGEEGFPGTIDVSVTYQLTAESLELQFEARSPAETVVNMTSHSYFNLAGAQCGHFSTIDDHELQLHMPWMLALDSGNIPTGHIHKLVPPFSAFESALQPVGALEADHHFAHEASAAPARMRHCVTLSHPGSGRRMEVLSTQPGMQIYTGQFLSEQMQLKEGAACGPRSAICFETQHYPDTPHHPNFPQPLVGPNRPYREKVSFRFAPQNPARSDGAAD